MPTKRYSGEEMNRRAREIFERVIKPKLTPEEMNLFVAIDIESKEYEIGADKYGIADRMIGK